MIARLKEGIPEGQRALDGKVKYGLLYRAHRLGASSIVLNGVDGAFPLYLFDLWDNLEEMESDFKMSLSKTTNRDQLPVLGGRVEMFGKSWIFSKREDHSYGGSNITFTEIVWPWIM